jgi:hypothetical protein
MILIRTPVYPVFDNVPVKSTQIYKSLPIHFSIRFQENGFYPRQEIIRCFSIQPDVFICRIFVFLQSFLTTRIMPGKTLYLIFAALTVLFLSSCGNKTNQDGTISPDVVQNPNTANGKGDLSKLPCIKFTEEEHDFGKIIEGETVSFDFKFRNTGKSDLIIADVSTSCGCTVPTYPRTPVRPGEDGIIKVAFNSVGKRGYQTKSIVVVANTQPNVTTIKIKAQVVTPGSEK